MAQATRKQGYRFQSPTMNLSARPNVYKRSLEARRTTDAYLEGAFRKAAGVEEEPPVQWHYPVQIGVSVLLAVAIAVGMWVL